MKSIRTLFPAVFVFVATLWPTLANFDDSINEIRRKRTMTNPIKLTSASFRRVKAASEAEDSYFWDRVLGDFQGSMVVIPAQTEHPHVAPTSMPQETEVPPVPTVNDPASVPPTPSPTTSLGYASPRPTSSGYASDVVIGDPTMGDYYTVNRFHSSVAGGDKNWFNTTLSFVYSHGPEVQVSANQSYDYATLNECAITVDAFPGVECPCTIDVTSGTAMQQFTMEDGCSTQFPRFFESGSQSVTDFYGGSDGPYEYQFYQLGCRFKACCTTTDAPTDLDTDPPSSSSSSSVGVPICDQPQEVGPCQASMSRWHYNAEVNMCLPFTYGGCQGNDNNFETQGECVETCGGIVLTMAIEPPQAPDRHGPGERNLRKNY